MRTWAVVLCLSFCSLGCGGSDDATGSGGGGGAGASGGGSASGGTGGGTITPGSCDPDPLKTGLVAQQTGVSVDIADCAILEWTAQYSEPDPMIVKAMIYGESRFDYAADGCPNLPCGVPQGWTDAESHCFGMMQVVPACGPTAGTLGLKSDGHPNLTTDPKSPDFANSIFNPKVNIHIGVAGFAGNRQEVKSLFPGCTEDQYTLMALGNLASHGSTKGCTEYKQDYIDYIMPAYLEYSAAAGYTPHPY